MRGKGTGSREKEKGMGKKFGLLVFNGGENEKEIRRGDKRD